MSIWKPSISFERIRTFLARWALVGLAVAGGLLAVAGFWLNTHYFVWSSGMLLCVAATVLVLIRAGSSEGSSVKERSNSSSPGIVGQELDDILHAISRGIEDCRTEAVDIIEATKSMSEGEILIASKTLGELYKDSRQQAGDLQSAAQLLLDVIEDQKEKRKETALQMQQIIKEIQKVVESINIISRDTHVLGVNARIEAAHAGDRGRGFGAVAQSLQDLNHEVQKASGRVHELSDALAKMIPSWLDQGGDKEQEEESRRGTEILQTAITKAQQRGPEIQQKLNEVLSHVQFQDILAKQLSKVVLVSQCVSDSLNEESVRTKDGTFDMDCFSALVAESKAAAVLAGGAVNTGDSEDEFESGEVAFF